jgi:hypothetical protein
MTRPETTTYETETKTETSTHETETETETTIFGLETETMSRDLTSLQQTKPGIPQRSAFPIVSIATLKFRSSLETGWYMLTRR